MRQSSPRNVRMNGAVILGEVLEARKLPFRRESRRVGFKRPRTSFVLGLRHVEQIVEPSEKLTDRPRSRNRTDTRRAACRRTGNSRRAGRRRQRRRRSDPGDDQKTCKDVTRKSEASRHVSLLVSRRGNRLDRNSLAILVRKEERTE